MGGLVAVAAGDRLNIRERPDASAPVIGTLAPDATGVEVVAERSGWAQVNTAERRGWVNAKFLRLKCSRSGTSRGFSLAEIELKGSEEKATPIKVYQALALDAPPGFYPTWLRREQARAPYPSC